VNASDLIPSPEAIEDAVQAAYREIVRQVPQAIDCSPKEDRTDVLIPNGVDLQRLVRALLQRAA
jgi:hypothetical protein